MNGMLIRIKNAAKTFAHQSMRGEFSVDQKLMAYPRRFFFDVLFRAAILSARTPLMIFSFDVKMKSANRHVFLEHPSSALIDMLIIRTFRT
jgi:hypothetical protein